MKVNILTRFPEMFTPLTLSMLGKAEGNGIWELNIVDIKDYAQDKRRSTDDTTYGGGPGQLFLPDPVFRAMDDIGAKNTRNVYMSPRGKILNMEMVQDFAEEEEITILCGHYEGVDERIIEYWNMEEISTGDYILTGGELPAMVFIDSVIRMLPGVLKGEESAMEESIYSGLLEYPQYTRPRVYRDMEVPEILLSGDHKKIYLWRYEKSLELTKERRPDLFEKYLENHGELTKDETRVLEKFRK